MFAKKALGQNFLMHQATADRIADAAHLEADDTVLEIGPGTGMLTRALLARAGKVIAIETDADLIPVLKETFEDALSSGKLELIHGDVRTFDTTVLPGDYHLVANIPYYITGEIIRHFLTAPHKPRSMTLLVQKEVAERIARSEKESLLSLSVKAFGTPKYRFTVPGGAFKPAPKVDSAVLSITDIKQEAFSSEAVEQWFFEVLRAGFAHKRKRLAKNLEAVTTPAGVAQAFHAALLDTNVRSEDVKLDTWKHLAETTANHIKE